MKIYKYRKSFFIIGCLFVQLLLVLIVAFGENIGVSEKGLTKALVGGTGFLVVFLGIYSGEYFNRYVEIADEYVRFNSFRFKMMKNTISLNVRYEDVLSVEAKKLPIIGIYGLKLRVKNFGHTIVITHSFCKHKELFSELCKRVKNANPNVFIENIVKERFKG